MPLLRAVSVGPQADAALGEGLAPRLQGSSAGVRGPPTPALLSCAPQLGRVGEQTFLRPGLSLSISVTVGEL